MSIFIISSEATQEALKSQAGQWRQSKHFHFLSIIHERKVRNGLVNMEMRPKMLNKVMGSASKKKKKKKPRCFVLTLLGCDSLIHEGCCRQVRRQRDDLRAPQAQTHLLFLCCCGFGFHLAINKNKSSVDVSTCDRWEGIQPTCQVRSGD